MASRYSNTSGNSESGLTAVNSPSPPASKMMLDGGNTEHQQAMDAYLFPSDSWKNGVYWAALPPKERLQFINEQQNKEWGMEIAGLWADFKSDPCLPFIKYWRNYVMP